MNSIIKRDESGNPVGLLFASHPAGVKLAVDDQVPDVTDLHLTAWSPIPSHLWKDLQGSEDQETAIRVAVLLWLQDLAQSIALDLQGPIWGAGNWGQTNG